MPAIGIQRLNKAGDTIIEVLLAMSLLSMIIFIAWGTTNRATQISTNARKRVVMVNALKEQAEIIKSRYQAANGDITKVVSSPISPGSLSLDPCDTAKMSEDNAAIAAAFHFKTDGDIVTQGSSYLPVGGDDSSRVWFLYVPDSNNPSKYVDFYIRGCWQTVGGTQQLDNSQFIVRLNT